MLIKILQWINLWKWWVNKKSFACEIIVEVDVDSWHILKFLGDFELLILGVVIYDSILAKSEIHVEGLFFSFPGIAAGMDINVLVSV